MPRWLSVRFDDVAPRPSRGQVPNGKSRNGTGALRYTNGSSRWRDTPGSAGSHPGSAASHVATCPAARPKSALMALVPPALAPPGWSTPRKRTPANDGGGSAWCSRSESAVPPRCPYPRGHRLLGRPPDRDNEPNVAAVDHLVEDAVAVGHDRRAGVLRQGPQRVGVLAEDRIYEGVEEHVGAVDPEMAEEVLHAGAGAAGERPVGERLVLGPLLADDDDPGRPVQPAAEEHGPEVPAERLPPEHGAAQPAVVRGVSEQLGPAAALGRPRIVLPDVASAIHVPGPVPGVTRRGCARTRRRRGSLALTSVDLRALCRSYRSVGQGVRRTRGTRRHSAAGAGWSPAS